MKKRLVVKWDGIKPEILQSISRNREVCVSVSPSSNVIPAQASTSGSTSQKQTLCQGLVNKRLLMREVACVR